MITKGLFTSNTDLWSTPTDFFEKVAAEFAPETDVCALPSNAKCERFFTPEIDGLKQSWSGTCWMNPPYGREIGKWVQKAHDEARKGARVICLLPARTDTRWFHDYILGIAETRFIKGRLKFGDGKNPAPFPSMLVIYDFSNLSEPRPPLLPTYAAAAGGKIKVLCSMGCSSMSATECV